MSLKLSDLRRTAVSTAKEFKNVSLLKEELKSAFPAIVVTGTIEQVADRANMLVETARRLDHKIPTIKLSVLAKFMNHEKIQVRKLAANLLPESFVVKMKDDIASEVRAAVAKKAPASIVNEMLARYESDDLLRHVVRERVESDYVFAHELEDGYGVQVAKQQIESQEDDETTDLSDQWYENAAQQLVLDYGDSGMNAQKSVDRHWIAPAINMYAKSSCCKNINIDKKKLIDAVKEHLENIESIQIGESPIKETIELLKKRAHLQENVFPVILEDRDPVKALLNENVSRSTYVKKFEELFKVKHASIPYSVRKYFLFENLSKDSTVPMLAYLPSSRYVDHVNELALDKYVSSWNSIQEQSCKMIKLDWVQHPENGSKISFQLKVK